jgi:hypothetical protein
MQNSPINGYKSLHQKKIPKSKTKEDVVKVYIWNQDKKVIYFDDLEVKVY